MSKKRYRIIILSGKQGSGKTTIMEKLMEEARESGVFCKNVILADTIYKIHDFAIDLLKQRGIERNIVKDGKLLQLLGTEWGRTTLGEDVWVKCLMGQIEGIEEARRVSLDRSYALYIISDCRFKNEFDGIEGYKVRLEASTECRKARCSQWRDNDTHISETDLDEYAAAGKFDLTVDTENNEIQSCVDQITKAFNEWFKEDVKK